MPISTRIFQPAPKNRRDEERVVEDLMKQIKERISDAMNYAAQASIYSPEDTFSELTTAQATVLTLFYGLLYGDVPLCEYIAQVRLPQLKSTFLRVWLVDDFSFKQQHVGMVLAMLSFLMDKNKLLIPNHIVNIFGGLVQKYDVADCCSKDLLTVFNEIHVQTSQHLQNGGARRKLSSSQSTCSEISNPDRDTNIFRTTFRRMGSLKLFQKNNNVRTKKVKTEEFEVINHEDFENENTDPSSECLEGVSFTQRPCNFESRFGRRLSDISMGTFREHDVVDSDGRSLLLRLAQYGRTEAVRRLLRENVSPDESDFSGKTALHYAVESGQLPTVELLLRAGADVNARTTVQRETPLHFASIENGVQSKIWLILTEYGGIM